MNYNLAGINPFINLLLTALAVLVAIFSRETVKWVVCQFLILKEAGAPKTYPKLLSSIDPIGLMMFMLVGVGWQKPLILPLRRLRNPKKGQIVIGLSGFVANFVLMILALIILQTTQVTYLVLFLMKLISFSMALTLVNLFPLIPLDCTLILAGVDYRKMFALQSKRDQIQVLFLLLLVFQVFTIFNSLLVTLMI